MRCLRLLQTWHGIWTKWRHSGQRSGNCAACKLMRSAYRRCCLECGLSERVTRCKFKLRRLREMANTVPRLMPSRAAICRWLSSRANNNRAASTMIFGEIMEMQKSKVKMQK
jgi:hypothetical protein